ncbi:MAG: universal stress protein [Thermodesulfovibrionales bacterium]
MKIGRVLAGIDLGPDTERVLAYASFFAKGMSASLNLLYVLDYIVTPPAYLAPYIEEEKRIAKEKFKQYEERLQDYGIKAETEIMIGRLHESFEAAIERLKADMLVLGFRHHTIRRSSSEKLIKGLEMPMLVVRGEKTESARIGSAKIRRLLCPTDFSEKSRKALEAAKEISDAFSSELEVMHVFPGHMIEERMTGWKDKERARDELMGQTIDRLDRFLSDSDIGRAGIIEEGEPYKKITSFSSERDIDLIVMGARGLGLVKGMIIGSVTDAVIKSSPCPVLVIH